MTSDKKNNLSSIHNVPGTIRELVSNPSLLNSCSNTVRSHHPHLSDKDTEAQRGQVTWQSHPASCHLAFHLTVPESEDTHSSHPCLPSPNCLCHFWTFVLCENIWKFWENPQTTFHSLRTWNWILLHFFSSHLQVSQVSEASQEKSKSFLFRYLLPANQHRNACEAGQAPGAH